MVYRKENGVIVPYANNSGQNVAADISIIDKNGKVVSAGGTTNIQALVSKISDDTVELSSDLASKLDVYTDSDATSSSLPDIYNLGFTWIAYGSDAHGFPENYSFGITLKFSSARTMQFWFGRSGKLYYRFSDGAAWTNWLTLGS